MQTTIVKTSGASTYWSLCRWTSHQLLKDGLTRLGMGDYAPPPRPPTVALKDALQDVCADRFHLVRPTADKCAFVVVKENRGTAANQYTQEFMAKIDPGNLAISFHPFDQATVDKVVASFNEHLGLLSAGNVSTALVRIVKGFCGTTLRENGGLYWLPEVNLGMWKEIAEVVEKSAARFSSPTHSSAGQSRVAILRSAMDEDACRAIRDAIEAEILGTAQIMSTEIIGGELGNKALENRKDDCLRLKNKIAEYEKFLGEGLAHLQAAVQEVETAAGMAALQVTAAGAA